MGWRYVIGANADRLFDITSRFLRPLESYLPHGHRWPLDVRRWYTLSKQEVKTIFDVGANVGQTTRYVRSWFPFARIYGFEPVKDTFTQYCENTNYLSNVEAVNKALGAEPGTMQIPLLENSELNTLTDPSLNSHRRKGSSQVVEIDTLDSFCVSRSVGDIDILKMDVQGYELEVLEGAKNHLERVHFVFAECGLQGEPKDVTPFCDLHPYLAQRGFFFCGLYDSFRHWQGKLLVSFANALYVNTAWRSRSDMNC